MMTIFARKGQSPEELTVEIISHRPNRTAAKRSWHVPATVFRRYDRFILYWDETFERLTGGIAPGLLTARRGPTVPKEQCSGRKDKVHPVPLLVSGKAVQRYRLVEGEFSYTKEPSPGQSEPSTIRTSSLLIGARLMDHYRVSIKPPGSMIGDNVVRLDFDSSKISAEAMCVILNSSLMHFIVRKYLFNDSQLTMFMQSVAEATPIKVPPDMALFTTVGRYMLALGGGWPATKPLMDAMDRLVTDPLVYELYLFDPELGLSGSIRTALPQETPRLKVSSEILAQDLVSKLERCRDHQMLLDRIYAEPVVRTIEDTLNLWRKEH
jgi:hypothetical protein